MVARQSWLFSKQYAKTIRTSFFIFLNRLVMCLFLFTKTGLKSFEAVILELKLLYGLRKAKNTAINYQKRAANIIDLL